MAVNQNRNSVRVLRTTGKGFFSHNNIPNLSIGTEKEFTIQLWVVKGMDLDGLLYGQEGGFSIRLADGQVIFSQDGFAALNSGTDWKVSAHIQDYIAIRYMQKTASLFIGGQKIAEAAVSTYADACTGKFIIGKDFNGGFSLIRVSDCARTDREILSDNAAYPAVDDHCVFQTDCSTIQYKDVSKNNLAIWAEGEGARRDIYTTCTAFSGRGQVSCTPLEKLPATHTLLIKLWPQASRKQQTVYTAMNGNNRLYSVELIPQDDQSFRLALLSGSGAQITASKTLIPELWQDVAVVFESGKATIYIDGARDGKYDFSFSGSRSIILVGSEYEEGKPYYEQGFSGYVAYTAEFGKILTADEIALYADDPPYMFEKDLVTLLPLDWPDEVEAIGATPLYITGSASFNMVAGITPQNTEIGCTVRLPDKPSEEWNALPDDEKWVFETLGEIISKILSGVDGYSEKSKAKDGNITVYQASPKIVKRHFSRQFDAVRRRYTPMREVHRTTTQGIVTNTYRPVTAFHPAPVGATAGCCGGVMGFAKKYAAEILLMVVGSLVVASVAEIILECNKKRPASNGKLQVTGINWNHHGDPTQGGLHYHRGGEDKPASMTDMPANNTLETRCVLVPSKLASTKKVDVMLKYTETAGNPKTGTLEVVDLGNGSDDCILHNSSAPYSVEPNGTATVSLTYDVSRLPADGVHRITQEWQFWDKDVENLMTCTCTIYVLPNTPINPWELHSGEDYNPCEPNYIRTEFIDFFHTNSGGTQDFPNWAVERLNASGFKYDEARGACFYSDPMKNVFKLKKFLADAANLSAGKVLNCSDCAHIVNVACAMVGKEARMIYISDDAWGQGFLCNRIKAIGFNTWKYPFERGGQGGFSYHLLNTDSKALAMNMNVYDACLKVDGGDYPGDGGPAGAPKTELLPEGLEFSNQNRKQVDVPPAVPFTAQSYRERLVHNGSYCNYYQDYFQMTESFTSANVVSNKLYPYLQAVKERFSLTPTEEQGMEFTKRTWNPEELDAVRTEEFGIYENWELEYNNVRCDIGHWGCDTAEEESELLASAVASYTHPDKRPGTEFGVEVGNYCVVIAGSVVAFSRNGHVFTVTADDMAVAKAVAEKLDKLCAVR